MTGVKMSRIKRKRATIGSVVQGRGGRVTVQYAEAHDMGGVPEIFITGLSKVERIGPGTLRFTFYSQREDGNVVVLYTIWDEATFLANAPLIEEAMGVLRYGRKLKPVGDGPPRKERH